MILAPQTLLRFTASIQMRRRVTRHLPRTLVLLLMLGAGPGVDAGEFPKAADLPAQPVLPDPLVMLDGRKVANREMWMNERRPELIRLFQHYMYGELPPKPKALSAKVARVDAAAIGGKATLTEVTLGFGAPEAPSLAAGFRR